MKYTGNKTDRISFPLGGIGTGCIGLSGTGRLIDWEIFGRPNKETVNGFSHIAVKAENRGDVIDARILQGDFPAPYMGSIKPPIRADHWGLGLHCGFGFGPDQMTLAGLRHFSGVTFQGEYPVARLNFTDKHFPGEITMTAFNPFIPMQTDLSGIPAAFFEISVKNSSQEELEYTFAFSLQNPTGVKQVSNKYKKFDGLSLISLSSGEFDRDDYRFGNLTVITDCADTSYQEYWYRGGWSDSLETFRHDFTSKGHLKNRSCTGDYVAWGRGVYDHATLAAHVKARPGETRSVRFVLSWYFPTMIKSWDQKYYPELRDSDLAHWKHYYASRFASSEAAALFSIRNFEDLYGRTLKFKNALFSSSLAPAELDAIASNLSTLKSPTVLRLENGEFYGFEGCFDDAGSCEGTCQHVWNYAYALPFLFPELERSIRESEFLYTMNKSGRMGFRLHLPFGTPPADLRACADGQMGAVIKTYREWKISGDDEWLRKWWPYARRALEYAWSPDNEDLWDPGKTGVLTGRQHHTLDMELFGPNSWLEGFYLCALKASSEMAEVVGEHALSQKYLHIFESGRAWSEQHLFNGEYYIQSTDLKDRKVLDPFAEQKCLEGDNTVDAYWNAEAGEIKYQIGRGCGIDQVTGQWHADNCGLGRIFDSVRVQSALRSIYKYNYHASMREVDNLWRIYSLNDEAGTVICTWPDPSQRPVCPVPYNSETMHGFAYQAAAGMIRYGLKSEALDLVSAIRDKYDGFKRDPYNEMECGGHYARSMASYSLLLAESGYSYDKGAGSLGFFPAVSSDSDSYSFLWSIDGAYGTIKKENNRITLSVLEGSFRLRKLSCSSLAGKEIVSCNTGFRRVADEVIDLDLVLSEDHSLILSFSHSLIPEIPEIPGG